MPEEKVMVIFYYNNDDSTEEPTRICSFYTTRFAEWMKCLDYCKRRQISFWPREDDEQTNKKIVEATHGFPMFIEDISFRFGSDECIQCIDVVLG